MRRFSGITARRTDCSRSKYYTTAARIAEENGDLLKRHARALYCSFHTTAGYLDQSLSVRLHNSQDQLSKFFRTFRALFPHGAAIFAPSGSLESNRVF